MAAIVKSLPRPFSFSFTRQLQRVGSDTLQTQRRFVAVTRVWQPGLRPAPAPPLPGGARQQQKCREARNTERLQALLLPAMP